MIFKNSTILIFLCLTTTSSSFFLGINTGCSTSTATINSNNMNNSRRNTRITHDDTTIAASSTSSSSSSSSSLRMSSTSATTKDLISPDDIYDNKGYEDDIAKMFDDNVFKTYGWVFIFKICFTIMDLYIYIYNLHHCLVPIRIRVSFFVYTSKNIKNLNTLHLNL